ncbi:MAG: fluoride efflux transporter CrcB [Ilumatobacter sp.]|nr:fluoride efflux transporter CrcB [Ilumatobacter sp.]
MRSWAVVALGGVIGATCRWLTGELLTGRPGEFPWATFVVNVLGCFLIGIAAARLARDSLWWDGLVVGALGGLTTFSAFSVETRQLVDADRPGVAVVYVIASIGVGVLAVEVTRAASGHR